MGRAEYKDLLEEMLNPAHVYRKNGKVGEEQFRISVNYAEEDTIYYDEIINGLASESRIAEIGSKILGRYTPKGVRFLGVKGRHDSPLWESRYSFEDGRETPVKLKVGVSPHGVSEMEKNVSIVERLNEDNLLAWLNVVDWGIITVEGVVVPLYMMMHDGVDMRWVLEQRSITSSKAFLNFLGKYMFDDSDPFETDYTNQARKQVSLACDIAVRKAEALLERDRVDEMRVRNLEYIRDTLPRSIEKNETVVRVPQDLSLEHVIHVAKLGSNDKRKYFPKEWKSLAFIDQGYNPKDIRAWQGSPHGGQRFGTTFDILYGLPHIQLGRLYESMTHNKERINSDNLALLNDVIVNFVDNGDWSTKRGTRPGVVSYKLDHFSNYWESTDQQTLNSLFTLGQLLYTQVEEWDHHHPNMKGQSDMLVHSIMRNLRSKPSDTFIFRG